MTKRERILQLADGTRTAREVAEAAGVDLHYVFVHAPGRFKNSQKGYGQSAKRKKERNRAILHAHQSGESMASIGSRYNISATAVFWVVHRELAQNSA